MTGTEPSTTAPPEAHPASPTDAPSWKLSLGTKLSYGISTFGNGLFEFSLTLYLMYFYTDVMHVPAGTVGTAIAVAVILDALTDIPMGWWSDRTRTRMGRRRPFILAVAAPYGLSMFLLFTPPAEHTGLHLFLTATAFYLCATVYLVPYNGLGTELTLDHHERTSLIAYRQGFYIIGLAGGATAKIVAGLFGSERIGFSFTSGICGVVIFVTMLITVFGTRERAEFSRSDGATSRVRFGDMLRNKPFVIILTTYLLYNVGIIVPVIVGAQVAKHVLRAEDVFPYAVMAFLVCAIIAVPLWAWFSKRTDKRPALIGALLLAAVAVGPMWLLSPDRVWLFVVLLGVMGLAFGGFMSLPYSIIGDTVDYDEYLTGRRREGFYWGAAEFSRKISQAVAYALIGQTLQRLGYEGEAVVQADSALMGLRILFVGVPVILFVLAAAAFWPYPLSKQRHNEIHRAMGRSFDA